MTIDLDKARAARREAAGEGPEVVFGGKSYHLPVELPFEVLEAFEGMDKPETQPLALAHIALAMFGRDNIEQMKLDGLAINDLNEILGDVLAEYGVEAGPLAPSAA